MGLTFAMAIYDVRGREDGGWFRTKNEASRWSAWIFEGLDTVWREERVRGLGIRGGKTRVGRREEDYKEGFIKTNGQNVIQVFWILCLYVLLQIPLYRLFSNAVFSNEVLFVSYF
jgi:hypothetical protein